MSLTETERRSLKAMETRLAAEDPQFVRVMSWPRVRSMPTARAKIISGSVPRALPVVIVSLFILGVLVAAPIIGAGPALAVGMGAVLLTTGLRTVGKRVPAPSRLVRGRTSR